MCFVENGYKGGITFSIYYIIQLLHCIIIYLHNDIYIYKILHR